MIPELFAVGTGVANFLQKDDIYQRQKKMKEDYTDSLKDLIIDNTERTRRLDSVSDAYNPAIMNDLNQTAVGNAISGVLNPTVYSQLIPQKANAMLAENRAIDERNSTIGEKISQIALMDIPKPGVFDFLEGGMSGYGSGVQMEGIIGENARQDKMMSLLDSLLMDDKKKKMTSIGKSLAMAAPFL